MTDAVGKIQRCTTGQRHVKKAADEYCVLGPHGDDTPHKFPTDDDGVKASASAIVTSGLVAIPMLGPGDLRATPGVWLTPETAQRIVERMKELHEVKDAMKKMLEARS